MRMSSEEEKQFSDLLEKYIAICTDYLSKDNGSEFSGQVYKRKKVNEQIKVCKDINDILCWDGFSGGDLL